jgi:ABC-type transport system involved in multi-copper enzyme maturation permease subunit
MRRLRGIFRFELAYQLRRPWTWGIFAVVLVVCFLITRDAAVADALYEDFFVNSPFSIAITTVVGGLLWLVTAPIVAGEAGGRDVASGMHPLVYAAPVRRMEYLAGRFLAALALNALLLVAVQLGCLLAVWSPGVNAETIGPFRLASYVTAYAFLSLPNAFVATALQFSLATRTGRPMASYLASLFLIFMGFFVASLLLFRRGLGTLLDPTGIRFVVEDIAHLWTTVEKNTRLLALEGIVLENRLAWMGLAAAVLAYTALRFRFEHRGQSRWRLPRPWKRGTNAPTPARLGVSTIAPISVPRSVRSFGPGVRAQQTLAIAWSSFRAVARSWPGLAMFSVLPLLTVVVLLDQMFASGAPLLPTTGQVLKELTAPVSSELSRWVIVPLLCVFFAGELVWREREAGLDEITDGLPVPDWVPLTGKLVGLVFALASFLTALMAAGMLTQVVLGYRNFDVGLYVAILLGLQLTEYLLFAGLVFVVHVVVGHKYVGHLVAIALYAIVTIAPTFGIEHDLLIYGAGPWWNWAEMRGIGPFVAPWAWFKAYWAAWALLLLVGARLLWPRGKDDRLATRWRLARRRLTPATARTAAAAAALIAGFGGYVFFNTNSRNDYLTDAAIAERQAEYERRYASHARIPQPHPVAADLRVEIHPRRREVEIRGSYRLENRGPAAIDSIHVATALTAETETLAFDRPATPVVVDEELEHRIYRLERPLAPGESMRLDFRVRAAPRGFGERGADVSIVPNGTFFTDAWLPAIGYQPSRELILPSDRREHGLAERRVIPSLHDVEARSDRRPGIVLETVIGTDAGQTAVAPGALRRTWTEGGRRWFHYATDGPIGDEWAFASADYGVREASWNDVGIRVYHHPGHAAHVDRVVSSIRASLDYLTEEIGPYPYRHVTVLEVPGDGIGMHADASMITHGEGITLLRPLDTPGSLDFPFAITAHEMAHQWAIPAAVVEGIPVMAESVATYYAMKIVERAKGPGQLHAFAGFLRQPHLIAPIRRGEPLLRGLDPWMSYRKGPYALHALSVYVGEEPVNAALRRVWERHRSPEAPLATTLDLYRELQAVTPGSKRSLLHDLFEVNAWWQFIVESATAEPAGDGAWRVTLEVRARKSVIDEAGVETELPMVEEVQIGVFAAAERGAGRLSAPLHLAMHRIRSGEQTITVTVAGEPVLAGIDPHHLLDWEENEDDDNVEWVTRSDEPEPGPRDRKHPSTVSGDDAPHPPGEARDRGIRERRSSASTVR